MLEEAIKYHKSLVEEKSTTQVKYGRNKLFNTGAVKQIVTDNNFLNGVYNKLKDRGKEIFGYHYNEIILSFIFIKYIKSNKILFERYLKIRNYFINKTKKELSTKELEKAKEKDIEARARAIEVDTAQANKENINEDTDTMGVFGIGGIPSTPVAFAKNIKNWRLFQNPIIKGAKIIKSPLQNDKTEFIAEDYMKDIITPSDIIIENINGISIEMFLKEFNIDIKIINVKFKFNDEILMIVINTNDLLDMVKSNLYDVELPEKKIINLFKLNKDTFIKALSLYIISEMDEALPTNEVEENDLIPYTKKNTEQITNMENINEVAKHPALINLDKIHKENDKNFSDDIKQLNKQVSEYIKDNSKSVPFDYEYDKDSLKPEDIVKYNQADPKLQQYIELNKGNGAEDIDFSIPPSQSWLDKLKNDIGEDNFKKMKTKAHLRNVERKAARSANVNVNDFTKKDKELASLVTVNENITAHYTDIFNKKNIITFNLSTINEATEIKPEFKKLEYQGLGYLYENKGYTSTTDEMSKYNFFFDTNSKQVTYVLKESTNINKEIKNIKKLISYKSGISK
jgi:hypothetical protein